MTANGTATNQYEVSIAPSAPYRRGALFLAEEMDQCGFEAMEFFGFAG